MGENKTSFSKPLPYILSPTISIAYFCETDTHVRLVNGSSSNRGRVEVFIHNIWGTVCDDSWTENEARVVCRQLGLPYHAAQAIGGAAFGQGSGHIWLDNVNCTGSESTLDLCRHAGWGKHDCEPSEDAGVACLDCKTPFTLQL